MECGAGATSLRDQSGGSAAAASRYSEDGGESRNWWFGALRVERWLAETYQVGGLLDSDRARPPMLLGGPEGVLNSAGLGALLLLWRRRAD